MPSKAKDAMALVVVRELTTSTMAAAYFREYCHNADSGIPGLGYDEKFARLGRHFQKALFSKHRADSVERAEEILQNCVEVDGPSWAVYVEGLGFIFGVK